MGPSSRGNELIYYRPPSAGGHAGFWEKLLTPEPTTRASEGEVSGNALVTHHPPAAKEGGRVWHGQGQWLRLEEASGEPGAFDGARLACLSGPPCTHLPHEGRVAWGSHDAYSEART